MSKKISRRSFIKKSAFIGVGSLVAGSFITNLGWAASKEKGDIFVIEGQNCFDNTIKAVELLGGMKRFVPKNSKVAILINSSFKNPGTIVHPDVALAVVKMCYDAGAKEICCIPGASMNYWSRGKMAEKLKREISGLKPPGQHVNMKVPGKSLKKAEVTKDLLDCDVFINVPIVKNHAGTGFTGTLKNMMGACPYSTNKFFHSGSGAKNPYDDVDFLSQCIADLNLLKKPHLCVVDATEFITTNGPFGPGKLKKLQKVVAGTDRVAVDAFCCTLLGLEAKNVAMIRMAHEHKLGEIDLDKLKIKELKI